MTISPDFQLEGFERFNSQRGGRKLIHLSLCSGIGGLDLAAKWAGFTTIAQCEIDEYASKVLAKNFPGVPNLHDIRTVTNGQLGELGIASRDITVISAGFPCQPYSLAGKGRGDRDERDLWGEVARVLGELKPRWFVGENTPGLFARSNQRYFRRILNDLAALGYRIGWGIWGAADVGAPHKRERVFIVAHSDGERRTFFAKEQSDACSEMGKVIYETPFGASCISREIPHTACERRGAIKAQTGITCKTLAEKRRRNESVGTNCIHRNVPNSDCQRELQPKRGEQNVRRRTCHKGWWSVEPDVGRMAHGIPARVDRLRCLGNAVVPAQAYPIFEAIASYEITFCEV